MLAGNWISGSEIMRIPLPREARPGVRGIVDIDSASGLRVWSRQNVTTEERKAYDALISSAQYGPVPLKGLAIANWSQALGKLAERIGRERDRLVIAARYDPGLNVKSDIWGEQKFCDRLIAENMQGAVPALDGVIAALVDWAEHGVLDVWHFDNEAQVGAYCVRASVKLSGAVSEAALAWISCRDAAHDCFFAAALDDLVASIGVDKPGMAEAIAIVFIQECRFGHRPDTREMAAYRTLLETCGTDRIRDLLRRCLPKVPDGGLPPAGRSGVEEFIEWASKPSGLSSVHR